MNVLYIYSGERKKTYQGEIGKAYSDTSFYGLNHLAKEGIDATYKEFSDVPFSPYIKKITGFRSRHACMYFLTRGYDVVFGASLLFMLPLAKLFRSKSKFVLLNTGIMRTLLMHRKSRMRTAVFSRLLSWCDGIVCLAQFQKKALEKAFPQLSGKVFFVPLGVDVTYHMPVYDGRKEYILSVGRDLGRDYGTVMRVASLLPHRQFHVVLSKRNLASITDIPANVSIFYDLSAKDLEEKYTEAALLLLLTHNDMHTDGSDCSGQTVLLDAMATGLPVIVTHKQYLKDYVIDRKEAYVVSPYNTEEIVRAIADLDNIHIQTSMAENARLRVVKDFSTKRMGTQLADVFKIVYTR